MAEASDTLGILRQNLLDAGCDEQSIQRCTDFARKGEWQKITPYLAEHRMLLLEQAHASQKQIDCLDFLAYRIHKEHKQEDAS